MIVYFVFLLSEISFGEVRSEIGERGIGLCPPDLSPALCSQQVCVQIFRNASAVWCHWPLVYVIFVFLVFPLSLPKTDTGITEERGLVSEGICEP